MNGFHGVLITRTDGSDVANLSWHTQSVAAALSFSPSKHHCATYKHGPKLFIVDTFTRSSVYFREISSFT